MSTPIVHRSSVHQLQTRLLFKFQRPDASAFGKLCAVPCHGFVSDNTSTLQCYSDLPIVADVGLKTKALRETCDNVDRGAKKSSTNYNFTDSKCL